MHVMLARLPYTIIRSAAKRIVLKLNHSIATSFITAIVHALIAIVLSCIPTAISIYCVATQLQLIA